MFIMPLLSKIVSSLLTKNNYKVEKRTISPTTMPKVKWNPYGNHYEDIKQTINMLLSKMEYRDNIFIKEYDGQKDGHFPIEAFYMDDTYDVNELYCESESKKLQLNGYYFNVRSLNEINEIVDELRYLHYLLDRFYTNVYVVATDYTEKDNILYPNLDTITVEKECDINNNIKDRYDVYTPSYVTSVTSMTKLIMHPLNFDGNIYFYFVDDTDNKKYLWALDYAITIQEEEYVGICRNNIIILVPDNLKKCSGCGYGDCHYHD